MCISSLIARLQRGVAIRWSRERVAIVGGSGEESE